MKKAGCFACPASFFARVAGAAAALARRARL